MAALAVATLACAPSVASATQHFESRPDIAPPSVKVTTKASPSVAPGYVLVAPKGGDEQRGPMMYDNSGQLAFFQPAKAGQTVLDFKTQTFQGKPVLTWWQGVAKRGYGEGSAVILDQNYRQIGTVKAGLGQKMDFHEFTLTPQGTALIDTYRIYHQDLSSVKGGHRNDLTMQNTIQEIDVATGKVLFSWDANKHIAPTESYDVVPKRAALPYDYIHLNSVNLDTDGNLIVSSRATHTVYKVDRKTGAIIWRLGGKKSSFRMGRRTRTRWQHDAHRQADGTITVFDNNADEPTPNRETRGLQLKVDETAKTVTRVRQWTNPKAQLSPSQGNVQVLGNGDVFMGWGGTATNVTEFSKGGSVRFEASFTNHSVESYRGYRAPWTGVPTTSPAAVARRSGKSTAVRVSWNGATTVASWRVLGGATAATVTPRQTVARSGFETLLRYGARDAVVTVEALDASGAVIGRSKLVGVGKDW